MGEERGKVLGVFYAEFDIIAGPRIFYQVSARKRSMRSH
jgi:hypothetical protein